jgi:hypothetical protein
VCRTSHDRNINFGKCYYEWMFESCYIHVWQDWNTKSNSRNTLKSMTTINCNCPLNIEQGTPDISYILMLHWFTILYLDPVAKFYYPENTERSVYFVGLADNVGYSWTFKILKNHSVAVLHRSVVGSALDTYIDTWWDQQQMPIIGVKSII